MLQRTTLAYAVGLLVLGMIIPVSAINEYTAPSHRTLHKQSATRLSSDTLSIVYDAEGKRPIFISGKVYVNPVASSSLRKTDVAAQNRTRCNAYLQDIRHALKITRPSEELSIVGEAVDNASGTTHYKIRQKFRGIPVLGAEATVHLRDGQAAFVGRTIPTPAISTVPDITAGRAVDVALSDLAAAGIAVKVFSAEEKEILDYSAPSAELIVFSSLQGESDARLAYQILIRPNMLDWWEYIVDARIGDILMKYNRTCDAGAATADVPDLSGEQRLIHTYQSDKYYLIDVSRSMYDAAQSQIPTKLTGAIVTYDYKNRYPAMSSFSLITSTDNAWDPKAVSAQYNASVAYEYYLNVHKRNSIDGNGGSIRSFINVADQTGLPMDNAYWNGRGMYYGNGYRVFTSLVAALDVAGHELTHGVIEATAALRYVGQSGALNESLADIFGCMIERANWTMGETVIRSGAYPVKALRDLSDPHNGTTKGRDGWQPRTMAEYQKLPNTTAGDNGGVHVNSGIPSYAYYLFASNVGKEKAEKVFYHALTTYLSASSQFADLRICTRLACGDLYGAESPEATALASAFDSVGITDDTQPFDHVADLEVNPGREHVLLTAAPPASDGTTMYIADSAFGSLKGISKRSVKFRPSISDDGKKILFVSGDKKLIALTLNGTTATETVIDSAKVWSVCAISRDGLRFAAVHEAKDTAMYIGSMDGGPMHKYNLNGPAGDNTHAITGAVSATALEWNPAGDNVVYDVFNSLPGPNGTGLSFWDIGFLRSWDPVADSFGDGEVSKLFSNLGDGMSVGNPTFSKNSPNILAYESIDDLTYSISVMTMNMENRKTIPVATTAFPGYPSYSRRDDRIAFSTINGADTVVSVVKVKEDKQTPDGNPAIAIRRMKWAVFFADGNRKLNPTSQRTTQPMVSASKLDCTVQSAGGSIRAIIRGAGNGLTRITILRPDGKIVHRETVSAGSERLSYFWNGRTAAGSRPGHAVYLLRIETPKGAVTKTFFFN